MKTCNGYCTDIRFDRPANKRRTDRVNLPSESLYKHTTYHIIKLEKLHPIEHYIMLVMAPII